MQGMQPKNYHTEGGNKWVVGGEIEFTPDAKVTGLGADDVNVAWNAITGKPAVIAAGATQQAAREAIGAAAAGGEVSVAWDDVTDKPTFAPVATTGAYGDLTGAPQGAAVEDATDDAVATVNAIPASLRGAGLIAT